MSTMDVDHRFHSPPMSETVDEKINRIPDGYQTMIERLDQTVCHLEKAWVDWQCRADQQFNRQQQSAEQHIQLLKVQAQHWKRRAKELADEAQWQNDLELKLKKMETELAWQRSSARQWQEKSESWKEEARRAEEARITALHKTSNHEIWDIVKQMEGCLDEAIRHIQAVVQSRSLNRKA